MEHRSIRIAAATVALALAAMLSTGCATLARTEEAKMQDPGKTIVRVNCGAMNPSKTRFTPRNPEGWSLDQVYEPGKNEWGAVGGSEVVREATLPIADTDTPDLYRSERYNPQSYHFTVPAGTYTVRLHCAETFECSYQTGHVFDVTVGPLSLPKLDVMKEANGFGRPIVVDFAGVEPRDGALEVVFGKEAAVNGIEVFQTPAESAHIVKHARPAPAVSPLPSTPPPGRKVVRMLFIGNSFTGFWELRRTIIAMVNTGPGDVWLEADQVINPGRGLEFHFDQSKAVQTIREGHYDYVSVQPYTGDTEPTYYRKFGEVIRASGAQMLIYGIWGEKQTEMSERMAKELGATLVPAGQAWTAAEKAKPGIVLIGGDGTHPGMYGDFLVVCSFYSVLTGRSPEGHPFPYVLVRNVRIEDAMAPALERIAWEMVGKYRPLTTLPPRASGGSAASR